MIKGVIFDLDGTLLDSEPCWRKADFILAKKYKYPLTDEFRKKLTGRGIKECSKLLIDTFDLKLGVEELTNERVNLVYQFLFKSLRPMPFALPFIKKLKKRGLVLALATAGHKKEAAEKILKKLSIFKYFSYVMSGLDVKKSKPAPDIYLETAKKIKLKQQECIVVEDAVNGVMAGKAAGMKVVAVHKEQSKRKDLKDVKADLVVKNLNIPLDTLLS